LLPGLINAHCHLDYTQMAGQFPPPKVFTDWLKLITATKAGWDLADYAESWLRGAEMLVRTGTTTVADIEAVPQLLPGMWQATPLRVISFLEMIGITPRRPAQVVLKEALDKIDALGHAHCVGLSPHAPYSTVPQLLRLSARHARQSRWRLSVHLAESALEYSMFARGQGEMFDWLRRSGRDMSDCGQGSPVQHLESCGLLSKNLLAAHVNYLGPRDTALLARRGVHVVHCPRSHAYFRHGPFPLRRLNRAGINVCLGTDSLASVVVARRQVPELNMFAEMRALADREPGLSCRKIIEMATINGARALGFKTRIGELAPSAYADLIAVPWGGKMSGVYDGVMAHSGKIRAGMIAGRWTVRPDAEPREDHLAA
jgi:cytosine/adenosine deaminase-related metal-dependent hydrolase